MKNIIRLTESDIEIIVRKTLLELEDRGKEFDMDIDVEDEMDYDVEDEMDYDVEDEMDYDVEDEMDTEDEEEYVSNEERQDFVNYVCRMNRSWCPKTKQFFSQMV